MARTRKTSLSARLWLAAAAAAVFLATLTWWAWREWQQEDRHDQVIAEAARYAGLDPALIKAVVWKESRFDENARGQAGEIGLMQLMDPAAQEWAVAARVYPLPLEHLFDPRTNTLAGAWYLAKVMRRYQAADNPLPYALADYNAGRGNALKWIKGPAATNSAAFIEAIGFPSTRRYVLDVLVRRGAYADDFPTRK
jgi:soluble lytic murein transglycosylase